MKLSTITSTSIVALAAAALIAGGASAAPNNPDAEKQCVDKGGSVKDGMCVMPEGSPQPVEATTVKISGGSGVGKPQPAEARTVKSSKSNSSERTGNIGGPPQPAGSANLNLSKSNINRTGCPAGQQMNTDTNQCDADSAAPPTPQ